VVLRLPTLGFLILLSATGMSQQPSWTGNLNINSNIAQSAQDAQSFFLDVKAFERLKAGNQLALSAFYVLNRQTNGVNKQYETTEDRWSVSAKYDAPSSTRKFGFVDQRFDRNRIVNLGLRSVTTIGYGYYAIRTENPQKTGRVDNVGDAEWRITAGLSYLTEEYLNDLGIRNQAGLQLTSSFRRVYKRGVSLNHVMEIFPSIEKPDDLFLISNLGLGFPISPRASVALSWITDYDTTPAPGARRDNSRYALTLGYRF
jgi:putative salt-induced outer membrane protein YdiY